MSVRLPATPLAPADAAQLGEALGLLRQGRATDALAVAQGVVARVPASPDALHLLALCRKALGDRDGALAAFQAACAGAPDDPNLLGNYANLLSGVGRGADALVLYRRALERAPNHADAWTNLGLALLGLGEMRGAAEAFTRAIALRPAASAAWQGLGAVRRAQGDLAGASEAYARAVAVEPGASAAWVNLGVVRRLQGDPNTALECYGRARAVGFSGAEIDDAEASARLDLGDPAGAYAIVSRLVTTAPAYVPGQAMRARLLWEHGAELEPGTDAAQAFCAAVEAQPGHRTLAHECIRFLLQSGAAVAALPLVRRLRTEADEPVLAGLEAHALESLGEHAAAARAFAAAYPALQREPGFLNLYARHLLRARDPVAAAARAEEALAVAQDDQAALAYLGVAWRLLDDPREHWLCGYDRLVREVDVEPPPGHPDLPAFLRTVEAALLPLHTARREPVDQSLRGGTQTSGLLFGRRVPAIEQLREAIAQTVRRILRDLPVDAQHPFLRRTAPDFRYVGSWSVRLASAGRHVDHFHPEGWISSAYYVSLPSSMRELRASGASPEGPPPHEAPEGWIQFGRPPDELRLDLGPRRVVQPREGMLVLFPSYLWHGTVPFRDEAPRLTVAFDALPLVRDGRTD